MLELAPVVRELVIAVDHVPKAKPVVLAALEVDVVLRAVVVRGHVVLETLGVSLVELHVREEHPELPERSEESEREPFDLLLLTAGGAVAECEEKSC